MSESQSGAGSTARHGAKNGWVALYRGGFGFVVFLRVLFLADIGFYEHLRTGAFYVPHALFHWLPQPGPALPLLFGILLGSAVLVALGWYYRLASAVLAAGFSYLLFCDATTYGNVDVLLAYLALLHCVLPLHARGSIDAARNRSVGCMVTSPWVVISLRLQVGLAYFFAGLVKLHPDWLAGETLRVMLISDGREGFVAAMGDGLVAMAIAGALFDLSIGVLLAVPRTRMLGLVLMSSFHFVNFFLLQIVFTPFVFWVVTMALHLPEEWAESRCAKVERWLERHWKAQQRSGAPSRGALRRWHHVAIVGFLCVQFLIPLRYRVMPGTTEEALWTGEGMHFSWWLRSYSRNVSAKFYVVRVGDPTRHKVDVLSFIFREQDHFVNVPNSVCRFARLVRERETQAGHEVAGVYAEIKVSLNGRPAAFWIDPGLELSQIPLEWDMSGLVEPLPARDERSP